MRCRSRARRSRARLSFAALHLCAAVGADLVGAPRECAPELPADQADDRRTLVQAVIAGDDLEHLEVARCGRKRADLRFTFRRHIQILYKACIRRQLTPPGAAAAVVTL